MARGAVVLVVITMLGAPLAGAAPAGTQRKTASAELTRMRALRRVHTELHRALRDPTRYTDLSLFRRWGIGRGPITIARADGVGLELDEQGARLTSAHGTVPASVAAVAQLGIGSVDELSFHLERRLSELAGSGRARLAPNALASARVRLRARWRGFAELDTMTQAIDLHGHADLDLLLAYHVVQGRSRGYFPSQPSLELWRDEARSLVVSSDREVMAGRLRLHDRARAKDVRVTASTLGQIGVEDAGSLSALIGRRMLVELGHPNGPLTPRVLAQARDRMGRFVRAMSPELLEHGSTDRVRLAQLLDDPTRHPELAASLELIDVMASSNLLVRPLLLARLGERALWVDRRALHHVAPIASVRLRGDDEITHTRWATRDDLHAHGIDTMADLDAAAATALLDLYAPEDLPIAGTAHAPR